MIIVADDLTGANDSAIQFTRRGFPTLVITHVDGSVDRSLLDQYEILSVNTDSRWMCEQNAYATVRATLAREPFAPCADKGSRLPAYYKKIDSMLRGNTAVELDAMMDGLDKHIAIVAPSFPENNRTVEAGILKAGQQSIDAVALLSEGMHRAVANLPLAIVRSGRQAIVDFIKRQRSNFIEVFVADALENADLRTILEAASFIEERLLLCGSAGFAKHIAVSSFMHGKASGARPFAEEPHQDVPTLVLAGTRNFESAHQIRLASQLFGVEIIELSVPSILAGEHEQAERAVIGQARGYCKDKQGLVLIAVSSMFSNHAFKLKDEEHEIAQADQIARSLGTIAKGLLTEVGNCRLITTGGDTSMKVCAALEAVGIEPIEEICPGIPLGRLVGGWAHDTLIVTKSGGFGNESSLIDTIRHLERRYSRSES